MADGVGTGPRLSELTCRDVGGLGEGICARWLAERGLEVVERNWRCLAGEVDIVADDGSGTHVLVEVKTRVAREGACLEPERAVDRRKLDRYGRLARVYLAQHPTVDAVRLDVAGVTLRPGRLAQMHYIEGVCLEGA